MDEEKIEYLYKYRPLYSYWKEIEDPKTGKIISKIKVDEPILNKHTLNILTKGELYFSIPNEFNDPYDCNLNILFNGINEKELNKKLIENFPDSSIEVLKREITKHFGTPSNFIKPYNRDKQIFKKIFYESYSKIYTELKISCFSKNFDNFLMWSHYSDSHKGICIGIDYSKEIIINSIDSDKKDTALMKQVIYNTENDSIEGLSFFDLTNEKIIDCYHMKAGYWAYENEYRAVLLERDNPGSTTFYINKEYIKELIFGSKVSDKLIKLTLNEIKKSNFIDLNKITIFKMKKIPELYKLDKIIINPNTFI